MLEVDYSISCYDFEAKALPPDYQACLIGAAAVVSIQPRWSFQPPELPFQCYFNGGALNHPGNRRWC